MSVPEPGLGMDRYPGMLPYRKAIGVVATPKIKYLQELVFAAALVST